MIYSEPRIQRLNGLNKQFLKRYLFRRDLFQAVQFKIEDWYRKISKSAFKDQNRLLEAIENPIVFDVGANLGEISQTYSDLFPTGTIYAFEPFPATFNKLKQRYDNMARIKPQQLALSNTIGTVDLFVSGQPNMNSLLAPDPKRAWAFDQTLPTVPVPTTTLDVFCDQNAINDIHILKFDIQGGEIMALQGAKQLLQSHAIWLIYTESQIVPLYQDQPLWHNLTQHLLEYDYQLFNIYNLHETAIGQARWGDAIYTSPQLRSLLEEKWGYSKCGW